MHRYNKQPIEIGRLQRYAMDDSTPTGAVLPPRAAAVHVKVACIGGGPASLACAAELRRHGVSVTVFDNRPLPGGLNTYGVAEYKLRPADSLREVEMVRSMGVEFRQAEVGADVSLDQLEREFDFIFIGVGLGAMERLGIPGDASPRRHRRAAFHRTLQDRSPTFEPAARVIVIGGGNTAIDAANAARAPGRGRCPPRLPPQRNRDAGLPVRVRSRQGGRRPLPLAGAARRDRGAKTDAPPPSSSCAPSSARPIPKAAASPSRFPAANIEMACDMVIPALGQSRLTAALTSWK